MPNEVIVQELEKQIYQMLGSKSRKSEFYKMPDNLPKKSYKALYDLEENHDNSWAVEIFLENIKNMKKVALLYRGNKISYEEMFAKIFEYAKSFKAMGIKKGDEVPVLVSNIPEYVYTFLALNLIGATTNTVGVWFHQDYLKEIFSKTKSKVVLISDDCYDVAKIPIEESDNIEKVVAFSLTDSLMKDKKGEPLNPYQAIDDEFHDFSNKIVKCKSECTKCVLTQDEFLNLGKDYSENLVEDMVLDDLAMVTYTSGTTKPGYPKGCKHSNRNYLSISRFKKPDVSNMPAMRNLSVLAHLPSYTQTVLTTTYSDSLYLGCTVALEPFLEAEFFPYSLIVNKPNFVAETPGLFLELAKKLNYDEDWKNVNMPYLMLPTLVGEGTSLGEEKYLNYTARKHKFGSSKLPFPLSPISFSFGGGSTENGGIFITLFKSLQEKKLNYSLKKEHMQLQTLPLADVEVIAPDGHRCQPGEPGMLVSNSPCNQMGYEKEEFNDGMIITDEIGKEWYSAGTYAIKDEFGGIRMVGRPKTNIKLSDGSSLPLYLIEDIVGVDTKNVLTTVIVKIETNDGPKHVCHIEKQPKSKIADEELLKQIVARLKQSIDMEILNNMFFRIRTFEESFPLAPSQKKDTPFLVKEGIDDKCVPFSSINNIFENGPVKKMHL